jgi:hypothetical protein
MPVTIKVVPLVVYGPPTPLTKDEMRDLIRKVAEEEGYDRVDYAISIATCESGLNQWAKSKTGDYGLWQIHLKAHPDVTLEQAYDPLWSSRWSIRALKAGSRAWTCQRRVEAKFASRNCVTTVLRAGYTLPPTKNGYAGTIPTNAKDIKDGQLAVAVTTEGPVGHVLVVKKVDGKYVSVIEGNFLNGVGRIVPTSVIKGFVL